MNGRVEVAFTNAADLIRLERTHGIYWEVQLQSILAVGVAITLLALFRAEALPPPGGTIDLNSTSAGPFDTGLDHKRSA